MKTNILVIILCCVLTACTDNSSKPEKHVLPWQVSLLGDGQTEVFSVSPGVINLRDFSKRFAELPELRLFQKPTGDLFLEAYLGKVKVGRFDARIIAEIDASNEFMGSILALNLGRKPTPNNLWQYKLSEEQTLAALDLKVWRFMYISIADYEEKQIDFFGKPDSVEQVSDTAVYRFYPKKGVVILWDQAGKETFYYTSPSSYPRLIKALEDDKKEIKLGSLGKDS
ncbi:hypothetical protein [Leucothrix arctica]|uniref:Lipoprotein n=1 Tax=Leucothrix arctica TaxID=1481894 RepID=A0A317CHY7_9GAMM|nr:hypothetical protein [Leucothrix arctica]PWQ97989.1 hypothetical protein DKT75_05100 [Leucothrix arctica]